MTDDTPEMLAWRREASPDYIPPVRTEPIRPGGKDDQLVYHYTNAAGLLGILRGHEIWATAYTRLNDDRELQVGNLHVAEALEGEARIRRVVVDDPTEDDFLNELHKSNVIGAAEKLKNLGSLGSSEAPRLYVACFCSDGDLLSQWRGYGADYAVGITKSSLHKVVPGPKYWVDPMPVTRFRQVLYVDESKSAGDVTLLLDGLLRETLDYIWNVVPHGSHLDPADYQILAEGLFGAAFVKHSGFAEEMEHRLVCHAQGSVPEFRGDPRNFVPYLPLQIDPREIKEIVLGPADPTLLQARRAGLDRWIERYGRLSHGLDPIFTRSIIPFRP